MKEAIINFLQYKSAWLPSYCPVTEVLKVLPFFEYLIEVQDQHRLISNNNWFWSLSNDGNRQNLIADLGFVDEFDEGNASYNWLLENFKKGKYGIMLPVKRLWTFDIPDNEFYGVEEFLNLKKHPKRECYNDKKHRYKIDYCQRHRLEFSDFEMWITLENILQCPLNFAEALVADGVLYGDLNELKNVYLAGEYRDIKACMQAAVLVHKGNLQALVKTLTGKYLDAYTDEAWGDCNILQEQLYALCEVPEGIAEKNEYTELKDRCQKIFDEFPCLPF
ncbi:MAG: hypothetical protein UGF89_12775 [Acutalibacteraceae bacterium]|nr:hypothetical protein [Acutalibacteraceae bacterium]